MDAELDLSSRGEQSVLAIISHLSRTSKVIDEELDWPRYLHDLPSLDAHEIDEALTNSIVDVNEWLHTDEVRAALAECESKLQKLRRK